MELFVSSFQDGPTAEDLQKVIEEIWISEDRECANAIDAVDTLLHLEPLSNQNFSDFWWDIFSTIIVQPQDIPSQAAAIKKIPKPSLKKIERIIETCDEKSLSQFFAALAVIEGVDCLPSEYFSKYSVTFAALHSIETLRMVLSLGSSAVEEKGDVPPIFAVLRSSEAVPKMQLLLDHGAKIDSNTDKPPGIVYVLFAIQIFKGTFFFTCDHLKT